MIAGQDFLDRKSPGAGSWKAPELLCAFTKIHLLLKTQSPLKEQYRGQAFYLLVRHYHYVAIKAPSVHRFALNVQEGALLKIYLFFIPCDMI